jgi:hypothetical protein
VLGSEKDGTMDSRSSDAILGWRRRDLGVAASRGEEATACGMEGDVIFARKVGEKAEAGSCGRGRGTTRGENKEIWSVRCTWIEGWDLIFQHNFVPL